MSCNTGVAHGSLGLINYNISEETITIVLTVDGAHLKVFLGNSVL